MTCCIAGALPATSLGTIHREGSHHGPVRFHYSSLTEGKDNKDDGFGCKSICQVEHKTDFSSNNESKFQKKKNSISEYFSSLRRRRKRSARKMNGVILRRQEKGEGDGECIDADNSAREGTEQEQAPMCACQCV